MPYRAQYRHFERIPTRWSDSDLYGHVNDAQYYSYFDTAINGFFLRSGRVDLHHGPLMQFCAESHCRFLSELTFPEIVEAGLQVEHLGRSSVRYGIGLFREGQTMPAAEGWLVQVFVDRQSRRPSPLTADIRTLLESLLPTEAATPGPPA